jgi:tetratricopeptide (TPR) repeat protein
MLWAFFEQVCKINGEYERLERRYLIESKGQEETCWYLEQLAVCYTSRGDFSEALSIYERLVKQAPYSKAIHYYHLVADAYLQMGIPDIAIKVCNVAFDVFPARRYDIYPEKQLGCLFYPLLDEAYRATGDLSALTNGNLDDPIDLDFLTFLTQRYAAGGRYDRAVEVHLEGLKASLSARIEFDPREDFKYRALPSDLAQLYIASGDYEAAMTSYETFCEPYWLHQSVEKGERLFLWTGEISRFIKLIESVIQRYGEMEIFLNHLYRACTKHGDLSAFDHYYEPPTTEFPSDELNKIGSVSIRHEDWGRAIKYFERVVANPRTVSCVSMMYLAQAYGMEGNHNLSIHWLEAGLKLDPLNYKLWDQLGMTYTKIGEYDKALLCYETFIEKSIGPGFRSVHYLGVDGIRQTYETLTKLMETRSDIERLLKLFRRVVRCDRTAWWAWGCLGDAYFKTGQLDDALKVYQIISSPKVGYYKPDFLSSKWSKQFAKVSRRNGQLATLMETYKSVIERTEWTEESSLWDDLHIVCFMQSDASGLMEHYKRTLRRNPYRWRLWQLLGDTYLATSELRQAVDAYRLAIQLKPRLDSLRIRLGLAYERMEDFESAIEAYETGIKLDPTSTWLGRQLGQLFTKLGRHDDTIDFYKMRVAQFPIRTHFWDGLAVALAAKGSFEEAVAIYQKALDHNPSVTWLWFHLGDLYGRHGDLNRALDSYDKALRGNPCQDIPNLYGLLDVTLPYIPIENVVNETLIALFPWTRIYSVHQGLGNGEKANELLDKVIAFYEREVGREENSMLLFRYGNQTYQDSKGSREFKPTIRDEFVEEVVSEALIWAILGEAYRLKGKEEMAKKAFGQALEVCPDSNWLKERLK